MRVSQEYPKGGCWNISVPKKKGTNLALLWENLVCTHHSLTHACQLASLLTNSLARSLAHAVQCFAAIGEEFEEPDVVGVALSIRKQEDVLSVWNRSNQNASVRFRIGYERASVSLVCARVLAC